MASLIVCKRLFRVGLAHSFHVFIRVVAAGSSLGVACTASLIKELVIDGLLISCLLICLLHTIENFFGR